jgi:hypothetical protein
MILEGKECISRVELHYGRTLANTGATLLKRPCCLTGVSPMIIQEDSSGRLIE